MPRFTQHCLTCAWQDDILALPFENPRCPRCQGPTERLWVGASASVTDDSWPGGKTFENYGPKPVTFYSNSERRRYMKAHGLEEAACYRTAPGTDKNSHGMVRWDAYPDPQTLENARILVSRQGRASADPAPEPLQSLQITVREGSRFTVRPD